MLVLSRKIGEKIRIDDNIEVTVLAISGNRIRIGICAPANMSVLRSELVDRPRSGEGKVSGKCLATANA